MHHVAMIKSVHSKEATYKTEGIICELFTWHKINIKNL